MNIDEKVTDPTFDQLVRNALDFIGRAISTLEREPKLSVIFFFAGTELFVKARLLREHWSLVLKDPKMADSDKFRAGDFQSVSFGEGIQRLRKICKLRVREGDNPCFQLLREHRNRLMHFYHEGYSAEPDRTILGNVVLEQCRAWYYLHAWLTLEWGFEFAEYADSIQTLHRGISLHRKYLQARYDDIKPTLDDHKNSGESIRECPVCGYEAELPSIEYSQPRLELIKNHCWVCRHNAYVLRVPCPSCNESVDIAELGQGACDRCGQSIDMACLLDKYGEHQSRDERLIDEPNAYCSDCEYTETRSVVPLDDGRFLCLSCLAIHDHINHCECCAEPITGEVDGTYLNGCLMCEGKDMRD